MIPYFLVACQIADHFSIDVNSIFGNKRHATVALSRHIFCWYLNKIQRRSLNEIGVILKHKHHTTILHAVRKIDFLNRYNEEFRKEFTQVLEKIQKTQFQENENIKNDK